MSIAVRYYTESHNTEKLCKAAADAIGSRLTRTRSVRSTSSAARLSGSPA